MEQKEQRAGQKLSVNEKIKILVGALVGLGVGFIQTGGGFVQMAFGLEIAHAERDAPMPEAMPQHANKPVRITGIVERDAELFDRVALAHVFKARPLAGLSGLDEADERIGIQTYGRVIGVGGMGVAALRGEQEGFDIFFETFFGGKHDALR